MGCVFARLPPLLLTILPLLSLDLSLDLSRPLSTSLSTSLAQPLPRPLRNRVYKVNNHPKFMNGEWTKKECLEDFLKKFEVNGVVDGTVTFEEFMNYYAGTPSTKQAKKQRTPLPPLPQQEQARNHSLRPLGVFERGGGRKPRLQREMWSAEWSWMDADMHVPACFDGVFFPRLVVFCGCHLQV